MTLTQQVVLTWSGDGSSGVSKTISKTGDGLIVHDVTLINGTVPVTSAIRDAGLNLLFMNSSIACTVTFRDAGGASVGSITLAADVPYLWVSGFGTIPISDDVATISCVAAAAGTLTIRGVQDATPAAATCALTGTVQPTVLESELVTGGETIILTLTGAEWVAAGAAFNAQRQAIIDGIDSAQSEAAGWDAQRSSIPVTAVVRTSSTVVTITLPALGSYSVTANETITATIPAPATTAATSIVASPTFQVTANS